MQIFYKEIDLHAGFEIAELERHSRIVAGKEVSLCSGIKLFQHLRHEPIMCWKCGCIADRWIATRGQNDMKSKPVLNLFAVKVWKPTLRRPDPWHQIVMMTRDHIIPKSLGGVDDVANLRPGCEICNGQRGIQMNKADQKFMDENPHLISEERRLKGLKSAAKVAKAAEDRERRRIERVFP